MSVMTPEPQIRRFQGAGVEITADEAGPKGGFWSLTMYDRDYFMLPNSPNRRTNIGTVNLDANELKFAPDGSLTLVISHAEPATEEARANWLPAPEGQFALMVRAYVPTGPVKDGSYRLPDVERARTGRLH